ncbi:PH domain-containing protein [Dolichospermum sp. ST_sed1]|nr:PH domain-containing protein [Dolichospermum sp. ST_sed1]MDD1429246.1 PH domain-containing protein [Dolichospermum sp. ST_sed9]MDD1434792.1 PH domain-containing protein [Dolichospermum sp. ST_sed6]MDD1444343.1 PH domain-containing protein [Dolichospermum sp. ST_sed3]MDD1446314.1 PH domain-containing protein [Dolichospermum sp. ST_sed8]MDD1459374.1 PH domain-containing protein [Dolichospermum sp. ST_sed2]MDD1466309.1 PH domain-containing protein [Dolichospermum sp. ST_sed5]MDD1474880.1 PH 
MGIREEVYYEGGPHIGDLIINLLIGLTVVGIPLAVGAIVRAVWLRFRITDRRVCVTGGWMGRDRYDVIYSEVMKVVKVPRGIGLWGDMAITLKNGTLIEMRAVPNFREVYDYINERVAAKNPQYSSPK